MIEQHQSLAEKFFKKGFWLYIFSFVISPIGYIIKIILSNELEVNEIGIIYGVMSLMVFLSAFNDFGMTESMNKFIPKYITQKNYKKVKQVLSYAFFVQMITGIIIFLFFYFLSDFIAINYLKESKASDIIKLFAFFFLGYNFFQVINTFFISIQDTFWQKFTEFIRMIFVLGIVLYIFFSDLGNIFTYSLSWVLGLYIGIIFSFIIFYNKYYKKKLQNETLSFDKKLFIKILKYAFFVFLGSQARSILSQIDMQMIIYILGTKDAGYYTNYLSIIGIPFVIIGPIFTFIFPVFSEMVTKGEFNKIRIVKDVFQKNFCVVGIAFNVLFFVFSTIIAVILFGEKFYNSGLILNYSILFLVFNFLLQINFSILAAIGKVKERLYIILVALVFNFITNIIFINMIGVYGARLATGLGWVLIWGLGEYVLKEFRVKFDFLYLFKNIIFLGIIGIFMYFFIVPIFVGLDKITSIFYLIFISIIYFLIFFIFNYKEFKYFIDEIKKILKK